MEERNRITTIAIAVGAVALVLGCLAGVLAGGLTGFWLGRERGERAAERTWQLMPDDREEQGVPVPVPEQQPFAPGVPGMMEGALVQRVTPGTAADEAGLRAGDIIVAVDDIPIDQNHDLRSVIQQYEPGDEVELRLYRNGERSVRVTLGESPDTPGRAYLGVLATTLGPAIPQSPTE